VRALRCGLDATAWQNQEKDFCTKSVGEDFSAKAAAGQPLPFDLGRAHALYKNLFEPYEELIRDKHLLVVLTGAMAYLPLQVLVTEEPGSSFWSSGSDYRSAKWLGTRQPISVLPSISSLKSLRSLPAPSASRKPFLGFGNPLLDGKPGVERYVQLAEAARLLERCPDAAPQQVAELNRETERSTASFGSNGLADVAQLKTQAPLPETALELCRVARSLGIADADSMVRLGSHATESEVKAMDRSGDLAQYRFVHFATHGALSGQVEGSSEPGLILTPPGIASEGDDGYLTASEIGRLKLDADWVILSACNTAGGGGEDRGALAGLARAFFYAGARSLLVSHWAVDSDATVKLVTKAFGELASNPQMSRAEALQKSMQALIADTSRPKSWVPASHPSVWAPFVLVGEGG
jgi:CHAT domain-containing protein